VDSKINRYLDELNSRLRSLPELERVDAVREIENHFVESMRNGKPAASVMADLGTPKSLAKAYLSDYYLKQVTKRPNISMILRAILFFITTGLFSALVVSALGFVGLVFGAYTFLMPIFGFMRMLGAKNVLILWEDIQIPSLMGVPVGIGLGLLFALLTWVIYKALVKYFRAVSAGSRRVLANI